MTLKELLDDKNNIGKFYTNLSIVFLVTELGAVIVECPEPGWVGEIAQFSENWENLREVPPPKFDV